MDEVNTPHFWPHIEMYCLLMKPVVVAQKLFDSSTPFIAEVYPTMSKLSAHIQNHVSWKGRERFAEKVHAIFMKRWKDMHSPLHSVAYLLSPQNVGPMDYFEEADGAERLGDLESVLMAWLNEADRALFMAQFTAFRTKQAPFDRSLMWELASKTPAYVWFANYANLAPVLQSVAMKCTSICPSVSNTDRNWSSFDYVGGKRRQRLSSEKQKNLVFGYEWLRFKAASVKNAKKIFHEAQSKAEAEVGDEESSDDEPELPDIASDADKSD